MSHPAIALIPVFKGLTLIIGGLVTTYSFKAYRSSGNPAFRALAIGFGIVTLGAMAAGVADHLLPFPIDLAIAIESAFTTLGFGLILYSLFVD